jgi:hypothetical protein
MAVQVIEKELAAIAVARQAMRALVAHGQTKSALNLK